MSTTTPSKSRAAYWQEQIDVWRETDQSQKSFCDERNLNYSRFGYWVRKLRPADPHSQHRPQSGFVPVSIAQRSTDSGLSLSLPNGMVVRGIGAENINTALQLLSRPS